MPAQKKSTNGLTSPAPLLAFALDIVKRGSNIYTVQASLLLSGICFACSIRRCHAAAPGSNSQISCWCAGGAIITSEKKEKKKGKREKGGKRKRKEKRGGDCLCHIAFLCRWSPWALSVAVAVCSSPSQRRAAARELSTIHSWRLVICAPELDRRTRV